jgi:hypothetical protein
MARFPYLVLVARGNHSHHPPFPTRLPSDIADDLRTALCQGDILAQTPRMLRIYRKYTHTILTPSGRFILSPEYQWLISKFGKDTLRAIHQSLNIEDRITAIIRAERIKKFPAGTSLLGMLAIYTEHMRC